MSEKPMPLEGLRVLDASSVVCGPLAAMLLADFGAEVINIEHPNGGDPIRQHGDAKDGVPLWWSMLGRNKKSITLYLGDPDGQALFKEMAANADVVLENFRPGTLARWGLDYDTLAAGNPGLVLAHISGYGQTGPRAGEPAFGTLAEAMSGFAHRTGEPDGPPTLPPFGLADCVTGIAVAYGVMVALHDRARTGLGQEIDAAICETLLTVLEPQLTIYDQLGKDMFRTGSRAVTNAPRGIYATSDGRWIAVSASTQPTAARMLEIAGRPDLAQADWLYNAHDRVAHADEIDEALVPWFSSRTSDEALAACREAKAPAALVYSPADILADEQFDARETIARVPHDRLGSVRMPNVMFRLSRTPGRIRRPGGNLGEDNDEVLGRYLSADEQRRLREKGVI
ncbi:MAG TPA: CoA transferase [Gaiellaceae bacterium]|jgi:formyl-CoA transferase|nr:CoA transferase [Gaiellaceae bacterium]